ncbi:hypothetical protein A2Z33_05645 [Candidatus Gottesmanbacteria bacterium RBG_16_52_11]|uniref:Glycosyltransferase RgtA/B/C/D-like domain-containing protein n=1 Tax=Candidatus Gottesmanbacteria bacterium RBG_16_52_11 TaxID=1798374 RepID=A0A1F5YNS3_9BACT|nr:MAG: hypothetical protein A2Z33_05645 [Candidatus Gottesmanbacteria bacterium RBG_16_52_11]
MALFFIAFDAFRTRRSAGPVVAVLAVTAIGIILYGLGQKFAGFPAFLTMNEEFAKGVPLRLPPTARITSTFGGHYDLAAYLVFVIPIFGSMVFGARRLVLKACYLAVAAGSLGLLLLTASRISFGVYLAAITAMLVIRRKYVWILPVIIVSFVMLNFVGVASERFYKTFRFSDVIVDLSTGQPIGTLDKLEGGRATTEKDASPAEENLPKGSEYIGIAQGPVTPVKTVEMFVSRDLATGSGEIATISGSFLIQKALVYDISITTRFQAQWPKAAEAFRRNIFLGSGYSTLSVASDGDYLRMLGETGIIGTVAFLGIILAFAAYVYPNLSFLPQDENRALGIGVLAGIFGLLLNAVLIDVFEASKVAFTIWPVMGITAAVVTTKRSRVRAYPVLLFQALTHPAALTFYLIIAVFVLFGIAFSGYFLGDDFTWLKWAATSSVRDIPGYFSNAAGFFYRPIPKLWYFVLYSLFWLKPGMYLFMSLVLYSIMVILLYAIIVRLRVRRMTAWLCAFLFAVLSVHHENVFWISGHSSLLGGVGLLSSILAFLLSGSGHRIRQIFFLLAGIFSLWFSMASYDGLILAPLAVILILISAGKVRLLTVAAVLSPLIAIWYGRGLSGALAPSGDYGVNYAKAAVNLVTNAIAYIGSFAYGPKFIELFEQLRLEYRQWWRQLSIAAASGAGLLVAAAFVFRKRLSSVRQPLSVLAAFVVISTPYLLLGNAAERFALAPSAVFVIALGLLAEICVRKGRAVAIAAYVLIAGLIIWNSAEVRRVSTDWVYAYGVSRNSLLKVKSEFFPLKREPVFAFVNVPIRHGRAWIFPTGMTDAVWHLFRYNRHTVMQFPDLTAAFAYPGVTDVMQFEEADLKRVIKEVRKVGN